MYARPLIDSLDFARNGQEISGEAKFAELPRLLDLLENRQGIFNYKVTGGIDLQGLSYLDIAVAGHCPLVCQRCLNVLEYPVQIETRLLLRNQSTLDELAYNTVEEEVFDSILANKHLDVLEMLEEEILLCLPFAPKHELDECTAINDETPQKEENNPFAILANLKRH